MPTSLQLRQEGLPNSLQDLLRGWMQAIQATDEFVKIEDGGLCCRVDEAANNKVETHNQRTALEIPSEAQLD
eukprot:CAMPEP_0175356046 /NCGR_PEP_ID=MMETSP0095-20121207/13778_1 /TAXON_ID=311494 /ORGANISM="Alexandrium monilatum, Strain CCMP3105" /LENGTH=71 /DNA_ID=CAMNT_0016653727 /DNA_START=44 /DNA_END=259 /DNA_ORIENTATION=+